MLYTYITWALWAVSGPLFKYQFRATATGTKEDGMLRSRREGREDSDSQPFFNFPKLVPCAVHKASVFILHLLSFLYSTSSFFFFGRGSKFTSGVLSILL